MKKLVVAIALISSFAANSEVIKLSDGTVARCSSLLDVSTHSLTGAYRPTSITTEDNYTVIKLEFLTCNKTGSGFAFKRDKSFENKIVNPLVAPEKSIQIERSAVSLLLTNESGKVVERGLLEKEEDGTYSITLQDASPEMIFHVQATYKMTDIDTGHEIDQGRTAYGAYRIRNK